MIVQPIGVPQSYLTLKWQILHFFATFGSFLLVPGRAPDDGIVFLLRVIPEILGNTRNFGFTRNIGYYPMFRVNRYPMISKTELGRVSKKNIGKRVTLGTAPTSFPQTPPHPTSEYSKLSKLHHPKRSAENKQIG